MKAFSPDNRPIVGNSSWRLKIMAAEAPSVHDIPKIHKLLRKRAKLTQKITMLQKGTVAKAKVVLEPTEPTEPPVRVPRYPSLSDMIWIGNHGGTPERDKRPSLSFKEDESGLIKEFFLRRYFDDLAAIDQELFDLGFKFPDDYAKQLPAAGGTT